jgi:hypothetical protein
VFPGLAEPTAAALWGVPGEGRIETADPLPDRTTPVPPCDRPSSRLFAGALMLPRVAPTTGPRYAPTPMAVHRHRAEATRDRVWYACVAPSRCVSDESHGHVVRLERCHCGATRAVEMNGSASVASLWDRPSALHIPTVA